MQFKMTRSKYKIVFLTLLCSIMVFLSWLVISTLSADVEDSSWDGVASTTFTSGTGTEKNPYVISSGGELAYFKALLEGNSAEQYASKNYVIGRSFDCGNNDLSINNIVPFTGNIDGQGHIIYNLNITNSLFNDISNATIKNLGFNDITYSLNKKEGAILANNVSTSTIDMVIFDSTINKGNDSFLVSGIANNSTNSYYSNVIVNNNYASDYSKDTTFNIANSANGDSYYNVYVNENSYNNFNKGTYKIGTFKTNYNRIDIDSDTLEGFKNSEYEMIYNGNELVFQTRSASRPSLAKRGAYSEHATGSDGTTLYINNLTSDLDYYTSLNYASSTNSTLPTMENKNLYNESNLVKVMITYSGIEENGGTTLTGKISATENYTEMVYYDYVPVTNGKIRITLIDNPFTNRPNGKGFNNWISDDEGVTLSYDLVRYERFAEISVTPNGEGKYDPITLDFHASWVNATEYGLSGNNWTNAFNKFDSKGLKKIETSREECVGPSMKGYYLAATASRYTYYTGYYNSSGSNYTYANNRYCTSWSGCTYYKEITTDELYDFTSTYYYFQNNRRYTVSENDLDIVCENIPLVSTDFVTAGYYVERTFTRNESINGYYNSNGEAVSGTCGSNSCTYYEFIQSFDANGNRPIVDLSKNYYYLVTRDTNIAYLTGDITNYWSSSNTKPFTLTGLHNGTQTSYDWTVTNNIVTLYNDTTIEHLTIYNTKSFNTNNPQESVSSGGWFGSTTYYAGLNANWHNLKIGRGIKQYNTSYATFDYIWGGSSATGSSSSSTKYNLIIESGHYSSIALTLRYNTSSTVYVANKTVYGSDVDKVLDTNNNNLTVYYQAASSFSGTIRSTEECATDLTVKSGKFGTSESDMYTGIYVGGLSGGTHYNARKIKVEGGWINNLIGGPLTDSSRAAYNDTYIYMTGGNVDMIIGGAGRSPTYGNRIIAVTGGNVKYGVLGGSNGSGSDASDGDGTVNGSSYIYIGGHAVIGDDTLVNNDTKLWGVSSGSVFGNGNGKTGYSAIGSNDNSYIIVDGNAEIKGSVYGGGNFGATGVSSSSSTTESKINIIGGTIKHDVYGGGNQNGAGSTSTSATITITQTGGTVNGSIYGGSNESGTIYGATNVNILAGTIGTNIYGGGKGSSTFVRNNSNVTIGSTTPDVPSITGNVYGGSGFGTVNGTTTSTQTSNANTIVTVNNGVIRGSVFGGGQGSSTYTPYVLGNITVNINGGDISNVYGGNDQAGSHTKTNKIILKGGLIENVYGGGNKSNVTNTNITLNGSTANNIYGGSNVSGTVNTTTIALTSGTAGNVYGGNNAGGSCTTTNITVAGTAKINTGIYGGGNQVATTTTNITLTSANGTIPNVYGGGRSSNVATANITNNSANVGNIFGGSNLSGVVTVNYIKNKGGSVTTIYGGNNAGGSTLTSNIEVTAGTIGKVYGGGNSAGNNTANVSITGGNTQEVYGGSNSSGKVDTANVVVKATVGKVFGGGNSAEVGVPNVLIESATVNNVYGGGNLAEVEGDTTVNIKDSTVNQDVYGGGNFGEVKGSSLVNVTNSTVLGSIYGGGNGETAVLDGSTVVNVDNNTVVGTPSSVAPRTGSVFGGGNSAYTGTIINNHSTTSVNIAGATIYGNVYGGGNTSVIYGNTNVNIGVDTITDKSLKKSDIYIKGHVFGGGEANAEGSENYDWYYISVTQGTIINVDANSYTNFDILGSFYGGGNASSASGDSYLYINNYGARQNPKNNISIQRVTYATLNNSAIALKGAIDRANDYDNELFSISRVNNLTLKDNSELYLVTGTNLLENFNSVTANGTPASVTIDEETNTVTKNVDNRLYAFEGKNINIAKDQQVTEYGKVTGMTFFGLFTFNYDNTVYTGNYSADYDAGDELSWAGAFTRGSYVLGLHEVNHDITKNGFYSNFMNEDTLINEVKYIEPTPSDAKFYMWFIGENIIEYNVNLTASKYSTLGSLELSFLEFTDPNTSFQILNFDSSELADGISLVDKNDIPRIASTEDDANNIFGLSMETSNAGWLTSGKTSFYTADPNMSGLTYYEGENSTTVPTMLFYLYHSKNISEEKNLGTVRISVMAVTKKSALFSEIKRLVINVNMSTALFQTVEYEGAMTPGDKYELFASTSNNITTKSTLSAYYALYGENENLYKAGYHRVLTSTFVLPVNTKITMIDFANNQTNYYYHVIDDTDVLNATNEYAVHNEASYPLSLFTKMGSKETNSNDNYSDSAMNAIYYDGTDSTEEFIFIVDFSGTNITEDKLNNKLLIEIRNDEEESIFTVLGIEHSQLTYNLYHNKDSHIDTTITPSDNPLYIGYDDIFELNVNYQNDSLDGTAVIDTQYFNSKLGVQIKILNKDGKAMSGTDLIGTYFEMEGIKYYPDIYGTTHIKLSDKVGNTQKWLIFNSDNSSLPTGDYDFVFETFGSLDGIYYGDSLPDYKNLDIIVINSEYGLNPIIEDSSVVFDTVNEKALHFTINYESSLENPSIRLALYRRKYDNIYTGNYDLVDLQDYLEQTLFTSDNEKEYLLISDPNSVNNLTLLMNNSLLSGTYKLVFRLYDGDVLIGEVPRYIIIKEGS